MVESYRQSCSCLCLIEWKRYKSVHSGGSDETERIDGDGEDGGPLVDDLLARGPREDSRELTGFILEVGPNIERYARKKLPSQAVEDALSDAFEIVWAKWAASPPESPRRRAWALGIMKNVVKDFYSRRERRARLEPMVASSLPRECDDVDVARGVIESAVVERVFEILSAEDARLLELAIQGYTTQEIGTALGISRSAVTTRISRVRATARRIRTEWEGDEHG